MWKYLFPCSRFNSPPYLDLVPTSSIISGMLLANIAYRQNTHSNDQNANRGVRTWILVQPFASLSQSCLANQSSKKSLKDFLKNFKVT